jgi:uncharacterized protein
MAVTCPRCGRGYDVTLFAFGRTIHCACGERVGLAARIEAAPRSGPPRFAADAMLGRLTHWLRILGIDVSYSPDLGDEGLVRLALDQGRTLLTRDRALPVEWRIADFYLVESEAPLAQLREVADRFDLRPLARPFSRCSRCNEPLVPAARDAVRERVPPRVAETAAQFARCPSCGRVYWDGSHVARMRRVLAEVLGV